MKKESQQCMNIDGIYLMGVTKPYLHLINILCRQGARSWGLKLSVVERENWALEIMTTTRNWHLIGKITHQTEDAAWKHVDSTWKQLLLRSWGPFPILCSAVVPALLSHLEPYGSALRNKWIWTLLGLCIGDKSNVTMWRHLHSSYIFGISAEGNLCWTWVA